jgi:phosphatidylserine/phosphatidylglycerophosphate/cardiolipin synthase-like enzyme
MDDLWKVIGELAATLHMDRIVSISDAIRGLKDVEDFERSRSAFGPNAEQERIDRLRAAWSKSPDIGPAEIAAAFRGAAEVATLLDGSGAIELVWTGPKTGLIPTRRTEQVILEVINSAKYDIFLVTYVFYKASSIVEALNAAVDRGVVVSILLESSIEHGGAVKGDGVKIMAEAVPGATIYIWDRGAKRSEGDALSASVHAKCAVADRRLAFITSANLTSAALERNMELGLLIRRGSVPERLQSHLNALVTTKMIKKWKGQWID